MSKHQEMEHEGREPKFILRVVKYHKSALSRQTGEAVRIRRKGREGAVLNSKGESNRSFIPRLQLFREEEIKKVEEAENEELKSTMEELQILDTKWERGKANIRATIGGSSQARSHGFKRQNKGEGAGSQSTRPLMRRKYSLLGRNWGENTTANEEKTTREPQDCTI